MDSVLNSKIAALGLLPMNENAYNKYLKVHEKAYQQVGVDINSFKYYKLYGHEHMLYSIEYLERTPIEDLLKADKANAILMGKGK